MIPQKIHYIWVGPHEIPQLAQTCIQSWKIHMPEYELILWNENNFTAKDHPYFQAMYEQKKWAFVSDFMRFWILQQEGGIYFDTDQEIFKDISPLLTGSSVFGRTSDGFIACGFIAAEKNNLFIKNILEWYNSTQDFSIEHTVPKVVTSTYNNLSEQEKSEVTVHSSEMIYPVNAGDSVTPAIREQAYMTHHWAESWVPHARTKKFLRKIAKQLGLLQTAKNAWHAIKK